MCTQWHGRLGFANTSRPPAVKLEAATAGGLEVIAETSLPLEKLAGLGAGTAAAGLHSLPKKAVQACITCASNFCLAEFIIIE